MCLPDVFPRLEEVNCSLKNSFSIFVEHLFAHKLEIYSLVNLKNFTHHYELCISPPPKCFATWTGDMNQGVRKLALVSCKQLSGPVLFACLV